MAPGTGPVGAPGGLLANPHETDVPSVLSQPVTLSHLVVGGKSAMISLSWILFPSSIISVDITHHVCLAVFPIATEYHINQHQTRQWSRKTEKGGSGGSQNELSAR